jgi:dihydrofolate reductase
VRKAYITKIIRETEADTYMPDLDADPEWEMVSSEPEEAYEDLRYSYVTYRRISAGEKTSP